MVAVTTDRPAASRAGGITGRQHHRPAGGFERSLVLVRPVPRHTAARFRRRRIAAALLVATVVAGLALATWAAQGTPGGPLTASGRSAPPAAAGTAVVQVAPGDTFWSIARRIQGSGDLRPLVDRLVAMHGGATLEVGERIAVPRR